MSNYKYQVATIKLQGSGCKLNQERACLLLFETFSFFLFLFYSNQLETVQKKAAAIILAQLYTNYETALLHLNLERLDHRRDKLCLSFALKCSRSQRHQSMFPSNPSPRSTTRNYKTYMEPLCNTSRYYNSSIPYLTRLLNKFETK